MDGRQLPCRPVSDGRMGGAQGGRPWMCTCRSRPILPLLGSPNLVNDLLHPEGDHSGGSSSPLTADGLPVPPAPRAVRRIRRVKLCITVRRH